MPSLAMLMLPIEQCVIAKDTSFALLLSAQASGYTLYHLDPDDVGYSPNGLYVTPVHVYDDPDNPVIKQPKCWLSIADCDYIMIRLDPPFDERYLRITWLLDRLPIPVINSPHGLRTVNEKLWSLQFRDYIPETIVTSRVSEFEAFLDTHTTVVIKPTDGFGGRGIFKLTKTDPNYKVAFETVAAQGPVIVQVAVDNTGDKRILLLNGEPLGAIMRQQATSVDHRQNLAAGGTATLATLTPRDHSIIAAVADHLVSLGLYFVGLDILGDHLIEINVTSPMGIRELSRFNKRDMAAPVIQCLSLI